MAKLFGPQPKVAPASDQLPFMRAEECHTSQLVIHGATTKDRIPTGRSARILIAWSLELTNDEVIGNGEIELRSWISALGAMGNRKPEFLIYEPFYSAIMGMAVAYWDLGT